MMCWSVLQFPPLSWSVSVAGCLGYDVLDLFTSELLTSVWFQLLVV
ncbi:hypothetical protein BSPWISOX_2258 [uncultured Gammaproteobacteria bacterium]|nr:hypothetical protein BSPWISOX_2258 [uncultured Gammaproteobacteria bacterium]